MERDYSLKLCGGSGSAVALEASNAQSLMSLGTLTYKPFVDDRPPLPSPIQNFQQPGHEPHTLHGLFVSMPVPKSGKLSPACRESYSYLNRLIEKLHINAMTAPLLRFPSH